MKKILIVEDQASFYYQFKEAIEELYTSCEIHLCSSEDDAIKCIDSDYENFDVLILDGNLSPGHGRNVLEVLTEDQLNKTIVCSADFDFLDEVAEKGIRTLSKTPLTKIKSKIKQFLG